MLYRDGGSIFGTTLDTAAPATAPADGTEADGLRDADLASISRTLAYNDPQAGFGTGEGDRKDRNVELLLKDPRRDPPGCEKKTVSNPPEPDPPAGNSGPVDDGGPSAAVGSGAEGSLPFTGLAVGGLLLVALALLLGGTLSNWLARRSA